VTLPGREASWPRHKMPRQTPGGFEGPKHMSNLSTPDFCSRSYFSEDSIYSILGGKSNRCVIFKFCMMMCTLYSVEAHIVYTITYKHRNRKTTLDFQIELIVVKKI
jgi:hypothetical protein